MEQTTAEAIKTLEDTLEKVLKALDRIERGLYGDPSNYTDGLIQRQKALQDKVEFLEREITAVKLKNEQQDLLLTAKKDTRKTLWGKIFEFIKYAAVGYLVLKGTFGIDAIFSKLF